MAIEEGQEVVQANVGEITLAVEVRRRFMVGVKRSNVVTAMSA